MQAAIRDADHETDAVNKLVTCKLSMCEETLFDSSRQSISAHEVVMTAAHPAMRASVVPSRTPLPVPGGNRGV